ncbi:hypothetical protein [Lentzea pudingi]|uniref:hypothetical protein n=1 Tax=Lentzea pudingi TaxID=1789439 RepID=UPI00166D3823|nr:hypothetical protein [Lentzea pudingi]
MHATGFATSTERPFAHEYRLPQVGFSFSASCFAVSPGAPTWPWFTSPSRILSSSSTAACCATTVNTIARTQSTTPTAARTLRVPNNAITPSTIPTNAAIAVRLLKKMSHELRMPTIPTITEVQASAPNRVGFGGATGGSA